MRSFLIIYIFFQYFASFLHVTSCLVALQQQMCKSTLLFHGNELKFKKSKVIPLQARCGPEGG